MLPRRTGQDLEAARAPILGVTPDAAERFLGVSLSARGYLTLGNPGPRSASLVGELGFKTRGFVEGYDMDGGPILLLGLALPW